MRTQPSVRAALLAGVAAMAVVLAGCSQGEPYAAPESDAAGSSDTAPAEAEEVEQDPVEEADTVDDEGADTSAGTQDDADEVAVADDHDDGHDDGHDDTDTVDASPTEVDGKPVIEIDMVEFAFEPETIEIEAGEPTILRFTNRGAVEHEAMVGDSHMQEEFAASDDHGDHGGDGHHGDTMAVTVAAGETADLEVMVDEAGTWYIGCHLPGHYDAGMEAPLTISG